MFTAWPKGWAHKRKLTYPREPFPGCIRWSVRGLRWNNTSGVSRDRATGGKKIGTRRSKRCAGIRDVPQGGEFLPRQDSHAVSHQGPEIIPADGDPTGWPKPQASPPGSFVRCMLVVVVVVLSFFPLLPSCFAQRPLLLFSLSLSLSFFRPSSLASSSSLAFCFTVCRMEVRISLRVSRLPPSRVAGASGLDRDRVILESQLGIGYWWLHCFSSSLRRLPSWPSHGRQLSRDPTHRFFTNRPRDLSSFHGGSTVGRFALRRLALRLAVHRPGFDTPTGGRRHVISRRFALHRASTIQETMTGLVRSFVASNCFEMKRCFFFSFFRELFHLVRHRYVCSCLKLLGLYNSTVVCCLLYYLLNKSLTFYSYLRQWQLVARIDNKLTNIITEMMI